MNLPDLKHSLIDTNLTQKEKIDYIKARCYIAACIHYGHIDNDIELEVSTNTLNNLNEKIQGDIQ